MAASTSPPIEMGGKGGDWQQFAQAMPAPAPPPTSLPPPQLAPLQGAGGGMPMGMNATRSAAATPVMRGQVYRGPVLGNVQPDQAAYLQNLMSVLGRMGK